MTDSCITKPVEGPQGGGAVSDSLFAEIWWRESSRCEYQRGVVVGDCEEGMVMVTHRCHTPREGAEIVSRGRVSGGGRSGAATVTRVDSLSELLDLVAARFAGGPGVGSRRCN